MAGQTRGYSIERGRRANSRVLRMALPRILDRRLRIAGVTYLTVRLRLRRRFTVQVRACMQMDKIRSRFLEVPQGKYSLPVGPTSGTKFSVPPILDLIGSRRHFARNRLAARRGSTPNLDGIDPTMATQDVCTVRPEPT